MTKDHPSNEDVILNYEENFIIPVVGYKTDYRIVAEVINKITKELYFYHEDKAPITGYKINIEHNADVFLNISVNFNYICLDSTRKPDITINNIKQIFVEYMNIGA